MRAIRRISQIIFFSLFIYLILAAARLFKPLLPVDLFTQFDPLVALISMISARGLAGETFLSLIVVGITLLLGRVFCGWICPLGTFLDISDRILFKRRLRRNFRQFPIVKYYLLFGLFVAAIFSIQAIYLLDPIALITRTFALGFTAPLQFILKWFSNLFYGLSYNSYDPLANASLWLSDRFTSWEFTSGPQLHYRQSIPILLIFAAILGLNVISKRYWCRNLCPLGALLGLISRVSYLSRIVGAGCNDCGRCVKDCKMSAIAQDPRTTAKSECIECFSCVQICPVDSIEFGFKARPERTSEYALDISRRGFLISAGFGLIFSAAAGLDSRILQPKRASAKKAGGRVLIRPPGAISEAKFIDKCVRCGNCMQVCPTNGLQPSVMEAGIEGFWTPILVPRIGHCEHTCNACGNACPTDAIESFAVKEKDKIFIGRAVIDKKTCIAWEEDKKCLVCAEYCSYKGVYIKDEKGFGRPYVDKDKCTGCGQCEFACPVKSVAAIRVFPI